MKFHKHIAMGNYSRSRMLLHHACDYISLLQHGNLVTFGILQCYKCGYTSMLQRCNCDHFVSFKVMGLVTSV